MPREKLDFDVVSILFLIFWERSTVWFVTFNSPEIVSIAAGEIEMIAEPKLKAHQDDNDRDKRERRHQEEALDQALKNTFPASDPVSAEQPVPPATDRDRAKT